MQSEKTLESLLVTVRWLLEKMEAGGNVPPPKVISYEMKQTDTEVSKISNVQTLERAVWPKYKIMVQGLIKYSHLGEKQDFK